MCDAFGGQPGAYRLRLVYDDGDPPQGPPPSPWDLLSRQAAALEAIAGFLREIALQTATIRGSAGGLMNPPLLEPAPQDGAGRVVQDGSTLKLRTADDPGIQADLDAWERDMRGRQGFSDLHWKKSRSAAEELIAFQGYTRSVQIKSGEVLDWLNGMIAKGGPGARVTARNKLSQVRNFTAYLKASERRKDPEGKPEDPLEALRLPRATKGRRRKGPVPYSWPEMQRLRQVALEQEATVERAGRWGPLRSTLYTFLPLTGLRYSEAERQLLSDIDLDRGILWLTGDKADRGDPIALPAECVAALRIWLAWSRLDRYKSARARARFEAGHLFPVLPSHHTLSADMRRAQVPSIKDGRKGQWHRFRKALASELALVEPNANISCKAMRHTDPTITLRDYTELQLGPQRAALEKLPRLGVEPENFSCLPASLGDTHELEAESMVATPHRTDDESRVAAGASGDHGSLENCLNGSASAAPRSAVRRGDPPSKPEAGQCPASDATGRSIPPGSISLFGRSRDLAPAGTWPDGTARSGPRSDGRWHRWRAIGYC